MSSLASPIQIPSRSTTPTTSHPTFESAGWATTEESPQSSGEIDIYGRPRSDTITTTSSASSDVLQTPQTPTILGVLDRFTGTPSVVLKRSDSYGFSRVLEEVRGGSSGLSAHRHFDAHRQSSESLVDPLVNSASPYQLAPPLLLPVSGTEDQSRETPLGARNLPPYVSPLDVEAIPPPRAENPFMNPPHSAAEQTPRAETAPHDPTTQRPRGPEAVTDAKGGNSRIKAAVRRKLERSKSSFKALRSLDEVDEEDVGSKRRGGRLRSLISQSMSRSYSSTSLRSSASSRFDSRPTTPLPTAPLLSAQADNYAQCVDSGLRPADEDGLLVHKARLRVKHRSHSVWTTSAPAQPVLSRPRAQSMPLFRQKKDLFGSMFPRELKVMIMSRLLQDRPKGSGRWDGEIGGRRELVKLSRVRCHSYHLVPS